MITNMDTSKYFKIGFSLKYWNPYALDIISAELSK